MNVMNHKTKLQLNDSIQDVMYKMSEGNPGALRVCIEILKDSSKIDPDNLLGGLGLLMDLDTLGLYGPKIWMLYKDVCGCNLSKTAAVLRGWQLGFATDTQIHHAIDTYGEGLNLDDICDKVCKHLPNFQLRP